MNDFKRPRKELGTIELVAKTMKPYSHGGLKLLVYDDVLVTARGFGFVVTKRGHLMPILDVVADYYIPALSNLATLCGKHLDMIEIKQLRIK